MNAKRATLLILTILVALTIASWLFAARIASGLATRLIDRDALRITSAEVASIGLRSARVRSLQGRAETPAGALAFELEGATVHYDLARFEPTLVEIDVASVDYRSSPAAGPAWLPASEITLPPPLRIAQLDLDYDGAFQFSGGAQFTVSGRTFTLEAWDRESRLTVASDASLSVVDLSLSDPGGETIAGGGVALGDLGPSSFTADVNLGPAREWLRLGDRLPPAVAGYVAGYVADVADLSGRARLAGQRRDGGHWGLSGEIDLQRFSMGGVHASGTLAGELERSGQRSTLRLTRSGAVHVTLAGEQVLSLSGAFPEGYAVTLDANGGGSRVLTGDGAAAVSLRRSDDLAVDSQLSGWALSNWSQLALALRRLRVDEPAVLSVETLDASVSLGDVAGSRISGGATLSGVRTGAWPVTIPAADLDASFSWADGVIDMAGHAGLGGPAGVDWSLSGSRGAGEMRARLEAPLPDLMRPFERHLEERRLDLDVLDGAVTGTVVWNWDSDHYSNRMTVGVTGARGRLFGLEFREASVEADSSDVMAPTIKFDGRVQAAALANGVEVQDLRVAGRWQTGFHLDRAQMNALGGRVKVNPLVVDPRSPSVAAVIELEEVDLERILEIAGQSGLSGSGRMSGSIPLRIRRSEVAVDAGHLRSTTRGLIRYDAGGSAATQLNNIAIKALEDFRYDLIDATLDYDFSGDYAIRARIEGRNPALYGGYPVAFNLNLTGTLPGLMRASLITGDFQGEILRQIQRERKKP